MLQELKKSFPIRLGLIHFILVLACAFFSFFSLTNWDGEWYRQICDIGYDTIHAADRFAEGKGNIGFFPGYPLACYLVKKVVGLGSDIVPTTAALLLVSNACAILSWFYLEKWLSIFGNPRPRAKILLMAFYPFSFLLCCAYTEALFLSMVLGFFYFSELALREDDRRKENHWMALAILHGFLMNFTRLPGIVLVSYPVFRMIQTRSKPWRALFMSACSLLSPLVFFAYCQERFGAWDLYFKTERAIWGTYIDTSKLLPPVTLFDFSRPLYANTIGKYITILLGLYLTIELILMIKRKQILTPAFAVFLSAGMMWGEYLIARTSWDFVGMGRFLIPAIAIVLPFMRIEPKWNWKWATVSIVLIGVQIAFALKFGRHGWVA